MATLKANPVVAVTHSGLLEKLQGNAQPSPVGMYSMRFSRCCDALSVCLHH